MSNSGKLKNFTLHHSELKKNEEIVIFDPYDHGTVTCENGFLAALPALERDYVIITERAFVKILNFDAKDHLFEGNFDLVRFDFVRGKPNYKFFYFIMEKDTYLFIYNINDEPAKTPDLLAGARFKGFVPDEKGGFTGSLKFINEGLSPQTPVISDFDKDTEAVIAKQIDDFIINGYS